MPRVTVSIDERDHVALRLLAMRSDKKMVALVEEAIKSYLERSGAYKLQITSNGEH